jgi:hypothetical protein
MLAIASVLNNRKCIIIFYNALIAWYPSHIPFVLL